MSSFIDKIAQQMMIPQFASGAIEVILNKLITETPTSLRELKKLSGQALSLNFQKPSLQLVLLFSEKRIDIVTKYDGEVECRVDIAESIHKAIFDKPSLTELINSKTLVIHGEMKVLQNFSALWESLDKSPHSILPPYIGDVMTYNLISLVTFISKQISKKLNDGPTEMLESITEEWKLSPPKLEVENFKRELQALTTESETLLSRVDSLLLNHR